MIRSHVEQFLAGELGAFLNEGKAQGFFDLERIMLTAVKSVKELATANRITKKARHDPTNSRWCNVARARYGGVYWSRRASNWIQSSSATGIQGRASSRVYSERQAEEFAGCCNQKRYSVSPIFGVAKKAPSVTAPRLVTRQPVQMTLPSSANSARSFSPRAGRRLG
jgi:hypothetical protein